MTELTTFRTKLRRFNLLDLENMIQLESDPEVIRFTPSRIPLTREQIELRLASLVKNESTFAPLGVWAVEEMQSSNFIGWFMLLKTEFEWPELGFMLVRKYWGKGFATEVSKALLQYGIEGLGFEGVMAVSDNDNQASIRVLEKIGFRKVSSRLKNDAVLGRQVEMQIFEFRSLK